MVRNPALPPSARPGVRRIGAIVREPSWVCKSRSRRGLTKIGASDDRDADNGWRVQGAQVAAELQEPGPGLARLDVPEQLVLAQLVGGEQVPHPGGAGVGRAPAAPWLAAGLFVFAADRSPLPVRPGCRFKGPNSST